MKKSQPDVVQELIDERWTMDQSEFEEKYLSLNSRDREKVDKAIDGMNDEWGDSTDDDDESLSVYDAALIWESHGKDEDYMFGYSEEELENALP